eukprot:244100_1
MEDIESDPSDYSDMDGSGSDTDFEMQNHYSTKNKHKHTLQCRHCSQIFFQNDQLMSHIETDHPRVLNSVCEATKHRITSTTPSTPKKKAKTESPDASKPRAVFRNKRNSFRHNSMQCRYCFQVFKENADLMKHISSFHSDCIDNSNNLPKKHNPKKHTPSATDDDILSLLTSPDTTNLSVLPAILPIKLPKFDINPIAIQSLSTTPIVTNDRTSSIKSQNA